MPKKEIHTSARETPRPPVVAIMGHIDHGKSTLLDYIRKSNVVAGEAGGITQHVSAYEIEHKTEKGDVKHVTFIDTPGHAAFMESRRHGATIADIAILIVSAEEGVKEQTRESLKLINERGTPFVVAITKTDKPNANPIRVKQELAEADVFVEGYGGDTPCVEISAKTGAGVPELLEMLLLVAELEEFTADDNAPGEGFVLESRINPKTGIAAVSIVKNGVVRVGDFFVIDNVASKIKKITKTDGATINEARAGTPFVITGLTGLPPAGATFYVTRDKKELKRLVPNGKKTAERGQQNATGDDARAFFPLIIKGDTRGTLDAIVMAAQRLGNENLVIRILASGIGDINERDMQIAKSAKDTIVIGFNVSIDTTAYDIAKKDAVNVKFFDVIYKITEYIEGEVKTRTPHITVEEEAGRARVIRMFNKIGKHKQLIGAIVLEGVIPLGTIKIVRNENEIGTAKISEIEVDKSKRNEVDKGTQFGTLIEGKVTLALGDILRAIRIVEK